MEIDRKKNFRFSYWAPESGTLESGNTSLQGTESPILGISSSQLHTEFFNAVKNIYLPNANSVAYCYNSFNKNSGAQNWNPSWRNLDRDNISLILKECHDCPYMGHMSKDRTKERVESTAWWPKWEQEFSEYINTCETFQKANRKDGKKYVLLQHIEEPKHPWETINMDWVTRLVQAGKENFNSCLIIADRFS
ncbi:hypothetical protein O181_021213 [Austropuccinia psidii MF-1]|uniref:Integrase zinc-binding domain-containing protein n=1 Tax=Austropuccinia psidii MF-1 TaxID=1389203 RepID=A0A9Q3CEH5_9BASI|nr:hypothetical protein [Austropuccinia psidii MF-1]